MYAEAREITNTVACKIARKGYLEGHGDLVSRLITEIISILCNFSGLLTYLLSLPQKPGLKKKLYYRNPKRLKFFYRLSKY